VQEAQRGDAAALDLVVRAIRHDVFALAARMLGHPDDAREASQEILIRVVTKLAQFRRKPIQDLGLPDCLQRPARLPRQFEDARADVRSGRRAAR
jgi:hypothetical protein